MRRKTIMKRVQAMPLERKVLAVSSIVTLAACFMPWYGINSRVINEWWNAFGSIGSVAGYIVFAFGLLSLGLIALPLLLDTELKNMPIKESAVHLFFQAQSFFVALLFVPVYSQYSLINATNSGTRFGLYVALLSTLVGTLVALAQHRKADQMTGVARFASVPSPQRSVHEWEEEEEAAYEENEMEVQEEMFTEQGQPVATGHHYDEYEQEEISENDSHTFDPYRNNDY